MSPEGLEKAYIDFSNNSSNRHGYYKLTSLYIGNFYLFMKIINFLSVLKYDDVDLITILVFFENSYGVTHSSKVSWIGINCINWINVKKAHTGQG